MICSAWWGMTAGGVKRELWLRRRVWGSSCVDFFLLHCRSSTRHGRSTIDLYDCKSVWDRKFTGQKQTQTKNPKHKTKQPKHTTGSQWNFPAIPKVKQHAPPLQSLSYVLFHQIVSSPCCPWGSLCSWCARTRNTSLPCVRQSSYWKSCMPSMKELCVSHTHIIIPSKRIF